MRAYLGVVATLVAGVASEQHILLDSTKESMLDWFKYPKGPQSPTPGKFARIGMSLQILIKGGLFNDDVDKYFKRGRQSCVKLCKYNARRRKN